MATRAWYLRNRDRLKAKREANRAERIEYDRAIRTKQKLAVFQHYSGSYKPRCSWCPETEYCCLTIDHINNDGAKRKSVEGTGSALYRWLIKNSFPPGYQVLCFNCNCGRKRAAGLPPTSNYEDFSDR